ncbi:UNVERIFIED_CONTAM: hypothetical protein B566_EDAN019252 [Ephemera danica]|nr:hypothetical protein B566_EDAN019252 [Ephemera danica]
MVKCCVQSCKNYGGESLKENRIFFMNIEYIRKVDPNGYPAFEEVLLRNSKLKKISGRAVVCSEHFHDDDFCSAEEIRNFRLGKGRKVPKLKHGVVPHINVNCRGRKRLHSESGGSNSAAKVKSDLNFVPIEVPITSTDKFEEDEFFDAESSFELCDDPLDLTWEEYESDCSEDYEIYEDGDLEEDDEVNIVPEKMECEPNYYLVDREKLNELLTKCNECGGEVKNSAKEYTGSMLSVTTNCINNHIVKWDSQQVLGKQPKGNVDIAASIFLSGITLASFFKFADTMGLARFRATTFYNVVNKFVSPVLKQKWFDHRQENLKKAKNNPVGIKLAGDAQFDSPGFSAKFCIYTVMDVVTNLIIDFIVIQRGMVEGELEKAACFLLVTRLFSYFGSKFSVLLTDRHRGVAKMMRENFPSIEHCYDIWHLAKSIAKKIDSVARKLPLLSAWKSSIINHLWFCAKSCNSNAELLVEKFQSVLNHVRNIHYWKDGKLVHKCEHGPLDETERKKKWLGRKRPRKIELDTTKEYNELAKIITNQQLVKDIRQARHFLHTGPLESFHNERLMYTPKRCHFPYIGYVLRSILAVLDHNSNHGRKLKERVSVYSKRSKAWVLRNVYEKKNNNFRRELLDMIWQYVKDPQSLHYNSEVDDLLFPMPIPQNIAPAEKIPASKLNHNVSRFQ